MHRGIHDRPVHRKRKPRQRAWSAAVTAILLVAGSLIGTALPSMTAASSTAGAARPTVTAASSTAGAAGAARPSVTAASTTADFAQPFHFLAPLGVESGDPAKFDASLLDQLVVSICRVDAATCTPVKTLTSTSSLSEQLRIGLTNGKPSYYLANWDVSKVKLAPSTFRVTVTVDRLQLGSIDVGPATYKSFGRTWPIKFRVENNPTIRVRVLRAAGKGASQIANAIDREFGLCGNDLGQLLANDLDPFSQQEIDQAVAGVCQAADIPATTKVADAATLNALTSFDPATGRLTFSGSTPTLASLKVGDVLVSEPSANAANGYLRKVASISKNKKTGVITVETSDALLNEAIHAGVLNASGDLHAGDLRTTVAMPGVTVTAKRATAGTSGAAPADIGDGFDFHDAIDVTLYGNTGDGDVSGTGTVHIQGELKFNAGYNVGLGIEGCLSPPIFTCVDRFETHVGTNLYSDVHVSGTFNGHLQKEVTLATHYFNPIIFFIGPIPVVIIPVVKAIAGVNGDAQLTFSFESQVTGAMDLGAKWTDPADNGKGWENVSHEPQLTGDGHADVKASMEIHGYGAFEGKLLLYGVVGPGIKGRVGLWAIVKFPGDPLWEIRGFANGELNFTIDIGGVLDLGGYHEDILDVSIHLRSADNLAPVCSGRSDLIPVALNKDTVLGPRTFQNNWQGFFDCPDPEGGPVNYTAKDGTSNIDYRHATFTTTGEHDVVITATDDHGQSDQITLKINVIDTPPILSTTEASGDVRASVQYFVTAVAWDAEAGSFGDWLPCSAMTWQATNGTITAGPSNQTCTVAVVFSQAGAQTVTVTATEPKPNGKSSTHVVHVLVGDAPANPAPVIDIESFSVNAASGPKTICSLGDPECTDSCPTGFFCPVPMDRIVFNGMTGDFHEPLTFSLSASDPNGDPLTVTWYCLGNTDLYAVTDNQDGTFSCNPWSGSETAPILIWAQVSDGTTFVNTEVRRLYMFVRLNLA
jgi:hypothetical protein